MKEVVGAGAGAAGAPNENDVVDAGGWAGAVPNDIVGAGDPKETGGADVA